MLLLFVLNCSKDKAYEAVYKEPEVINKSLISTYDNPGKTVVYNKGVPELEVAVQDNVYLYVPTIEDVSYYSSASRPYWVGDQKLVTFEFTKEALKVSEIKVDDRFNKEEIHKRSILEIPVEHVDYRCRKNSDDECSNEEEENDDISWRSKRYADFDFEGIKINEANSLPVELSNLFFPCHQEKSSKLHSWSITGDQVHIVIDKTFTTSALCGDVRSWEDLENLTFVSRYHYSFRKLNSIASENYKPILYYAQDENAFGFFKSGLTKLSADNRKVYYSEQVMMNRFNPEKKKVQYYLSENFYKPEYTGILKSTRAAVDVINESFKKAGTNIEIELSDESREAHGLDIVNSIIMVEEPVGSGILGYGPSVYNPVNGEILQAQTAMYYGNLLTTIGRSWDDIVDKMAMEQATQAVAPAAKSSSASVSQNIVRKFNSKTIKSMNELVWDHTKNLNLGVTHNAIAEKFDLMKMNNFVNTNTSNVKERMKRVFQELRNTEDTLEIFSKHNIFSGDFLNVSKVVSRLIKEKNWKNDQVLPWMYLSDAQRQNVIDVLMPYLWQSVLVHELGHNLGLRHNFSGSEDVANHYSASELKKMGITDPIPYSSVMDYTYSEINALPVMGKYDIAALQFGYSRKVEDKEGKLHSINMSITELEKGKNPIALSDLKDYQYCSDEGVYLNATCNRFDEGSNYEEIADHYIKAYYDFFSYTNFKRDRLNYSAFDNLGHLRGKYRRTFFPLRKFFDTFELFNDYAKKGYIQPSDPQFVSLSRAVVKVASFLVGILQMPDAQCKIYDSSQGTAFWYPLKDLNAPSCFAVDYLSSPYIIIGQAGQLFNDIKSFQNTSTYIDEIDVRGLWMDKLLAAETLLMRHHGVTTFDKYLDNFLSIDVDIPVDAKGTTVKQALSAIFNSMVDGISKVQVPVQYIDGSVAMEEAVFDLSESYFIPDSISDYFNRVLGLQKGKTHFTSLLIDTILDNNGPLDSRKNELTKAYIVYKDSPEIDSHLNSIETKFGDFFYEDDATKIKGIVSKMEMIDLMDGKDLGILSDIAGLKIEGKNRGQITSALAQDFDKQALDLYESYKDLFDNLASFDKVHLNNFLAGEYDEIPDDVISTIIFLPTEVVEAAAKPENTSGDKIAKGYFESAVGTPADYQDIIAAVDETEDADTLTTYANQMLNTKDHYEQMISSLAR